MDDTVMEAPPPAEAERELAMALASAPQLPALVEEIKASRGLMPAPLEQMTAVAEFLAKSAHMTPAAFQGNPDACLAVVYQAARWQLDPVAVIGKAYVTNNRVGYEAQLYMALINSRGGLRGPMTFRFYGENDKRYCVARAFVKGHKEPLELASPMVGRIRVKNSPLWFTDVDQQLRYYTARAWARTYRPEVFMGVLTADELEYLDVIDHAEARRRQDDPWAEATDAEFTAIETSGGETWNPPQGGGKSNGRHPNAPPDDGPSGGGRGKPQEPQDMTELRQWMDAQVEKAKASTAGVEKLEEAVQFMLGTKNFKRLLGYDQAYAKAGQRKIEDRIAELKG